MIGLIVNVRRAFANSLLSCISIYAGESINLQEENAIKKP